MQGGLVDGQTDPGAQVWLDGKPVRVDANGRFIFGFGRDAAADAELRVKRADGAIEVLPLKIARRDYDIQRIEGLPPAQVTPPPTVLERIRRENAAIAEARKVDTPEMMFARGFIWPAEGKISGVYGSQRILNGEPRQPHFGLDIANAVGTPLKAMAEGIVLLAEPDLYYTGGTVIIDHGFGLSATYSHLSRIDVAKGARVAQGAQIGLMGATGRVTGPHLDLRLNWFDVRLDPALVLPKRDP